MPAAAFFVFASYLAQAGAAVFLAIVLLAFFRMYRRDYLLQWAWSWVALTFYLVAGAVSLYSTTFVKANHPLRLGFSSLSLVASYLQVAWLLAGTYEVATGRIFSRPRSRVVFALLAVVGFASAVAFASLSGGAHVRFLVRVGLRSAVAGAAFIAAGIVVLRVGLKRAGIGRRLVSGAFLAYGLQQLHYASIGVYQLVTRDVPSYAAYLSLGDVLLQTVVGIGMVVWLLEEERARVIDAARQADTLAFSDLLTGLPNRRLLLDRLRLAIGLAGRSQEGVAMLVVDVDRFKAINETLGYAGGDELLRSVGERLRRVVRAGDTVARVGADEFGVLLSGASEGQETATAARIQSALSEPFVVQRHEQSVTVAIGIAVVHGGDHEAGQVLATAELALAQAREEGYGLVRHYNAAVGAVARERLTLETALQRAHARGEMVLHFQPIVDLRSGAFEAVEALIRWQHPERGLLYPADFLALAESSGAMTEITPWVLHTACRELREIRSGIAPRLRVAVNLAARSFSDPELLGHVTSALVAAGLPPDALELEITETVAMQDAAVTRSVLATLKQVGIRLAIDDFGTGYSSLSYLRTYPIDTLKLDRSFVEDLSRDPDAAAISAAIVTMAHSLRMQVVAEGVETEEQRLLLLRQGCDRLQGFLFSPALPAAQCRVLLASTASASPARLRLAVS